MNGETRGPQSQEQIALHRWAVIAEAAGPQLTHQPTGSAGPPDRRALSRAPAGRVVPPLLPRAPISRSLSLAHGRLSTLKPPPQASPQVVRAHPELFAEAAALRLELPGRSAAQIASILYHRHGITVSERTVRGQLRRYRAAPRGAGRRAGKTSAV